MEQLIKKIQKLREWEHLGLITTTGNTSNKGLSEFLFELENEALRLFAVMPSLPDANPHICPECSWQCACSDQPCSCCSGNEA